MDGGATLKNKLLRQVKRAKIVVEN